MTVRAAQPTVVLAGPKVRIVSIRGDPRPLVTGVANETEQGDETDGCRSQSGMVLVPDKLARRDRTDDTPSASKTQLNAKLGSKDEVFNQASRRDWRAQSTPYPNLIERRGEDRGEHEHKTKPDHGVLCDYRRERYPQRRGQHLPETQQRRGCTGAIAKRRKCLRAAERIDHAHSQEEDACAGKKWQKAPVEQRKQQYHAAADTGECEADADRSVETEIRNDFRRDNARAEDDHDRACEEQAELQWGEVEALNQDTRQRRKHCKQRAQDEADSRGRNHEAAVSRKRPVVPGDRRCIERGAWCEVSFFECGKKCHGGNSGEDRDEDKGRTPTKK